MDTSIPLKRLSESSYFAVHYSFLKSMAIPSQVGAAPQKPKASLCNTSFLVYYKINPALERAHIIGIYPLKIDNDNSDFWLGYHYDQL